MGGFLANLDRNGQTIWNICGRYVEDMPKFEKEVFYFMKQCPGTLIEEAYSILMPELAQGSMIKFIYEQISSGNTSVETASALWPALCDIIEDYSLKNAQVFMDKIRQA